MKKLNMSLVGLIQAIAVLAYCALIAGLLSIISDITISPSPIIAGSIMLSLLVVSAAITGSIVFAYPAYLALKEKTTEAIYVLLYTILYLIGLIVIGVVFVTSINLA